VGEAAPDDDSAVIVRHLDMGLLVDVRQTWAFYRDRNPAAYTSLVQP
jgi:N-carbamoylputrescine amidase